ncbi:uncharacterized protein LOC117124893 [Anneissia japonica]|uniref:uncharacterized protein LOC117124893 n=1 Tax=Anneissia japonica TaxID=1529436 RepID=UPI001425ADDF|nr:uncharacterized protein LOC117124893 [Anneissia japonica]
MTSVPASERLVLIGNRRLKYDSEELLPLVDSSDLLGDGDALRRTLESDGYLLIRGLHDRQDVLNARSRVLQHIHDSGEDKLNNAYPLQEGVLNHRCRAGCVPFMEGANSLTQCESVKRVLEGKRAFDFFRTLFEEEPRTFDYKWLRAMHMEGFTGVHVDNVYMGRGTDKLLTMWTPFDDVIIEKGTLAVCQSSHRLPSFRHFQETYGSFDVEAGGLEGTGWFTNDPLEITRQFGGQWRTADFQAGDALIFTVRTVHMSTVNTTHFARISCDTRWLPSSHQPDPRYVGKISQPAPKFGVHGEGAGHKSNGVTMGELKRKWGFPEL